MRMPSTPSPWPALLVSLALHALVVLAAWYFVASDARPPMQMGSVKETADRLSLSIIFGSLPKSREPAKLIDTKIVESTATDPSVELDAMPGFNPIISSPPSVPIVAAPQTTPKSPGSATPPNKSGSQPGPTVAGHGEGGAGEGPFFPADAKVHSVVYVIDRSASMGLNHAFSRASAELLTSLQQLPPDVQFQVIAYNDGLPHCLVAPERLVPAQPEIVAQFVHAINDRHLLPEGKTNHVAALRYALLVLNPDAIFWVTDGDDFKQGDLNDLRKVMRGPTAIHLIEMVSGGTPNADRPIVQLTKVTRGTYRAVRIAEPVTAIPGLLPQ